ncbi:MAG: hypothetical protein LBQ12_16395 [Deltaproteobacteria bacterium]|jgi:hypothetical protein|nr:hypothetical protein [Deltaproteobacteria bacterium]
MAKGKPSSFREELLARQGKAAAPSRIIALKRFPGKPPEALRRAVRSQSGRGRERRLEKP